MKITKKQARSLAHACFLAAEWCAADADANQGQGSVGNIPAAENYRKSPEYRSAVRGMNKWRRWEKRLRSYGQDSSSSS